MLSFMHLAIVKKMAVVNGVGQNRGNAGGTNQFACGCSDATLAEEMAQAVERFLAGRIPLKGFFDNRGALPIHADTFNAGIIMIPKRGATGIFAFADFFTQPTFRVFGKRINVVFAESKIIMEHELSLRSILKPRTGEFERFNFAGIEQIDDASAVHAVAGQTVGVPRENSFRFSGLYALQHRIENRSARCLGGLFFNQFVNNGEFFARGKLAQFIDLRVNREDLLVLNIGGFASVEK